jgi:lysophospholipase L1-like esterase
VAYDVPVAGKGSPPITVTCTPAAGAAFKNGTTAVTCEATDSRGRKAACTFSVVVTPVPQLLKTTFMALGDSLTEGVAKVLPSIIKVPDKHFNASGSYPELLNAKLTSRYQDQTITVIADGWGGETAGEGKLRLQADWSQYNPDALLVMEGTNDITDPTSRTADGMNKAMDSVIEALRTDITFAKGRGARVFLGTLLPLAPPVAPNAIAAIPVLNARIRTLADEQGVTLVNINAVVPASMLSADGIHPKAGSEAYSLMADEWLKAIIATLEVKPLPLQ